MPMATEMLNASIDRVAGHDRLLIGNEVDDDLRDREADDHAQQPTDAGEHDRLDQELLGDIRRLAPSAGGCRSRGSARSRSPA